MFRLLLIAMLCAVPAAAQIDWDTDNYGVFFDLEGTQTAMMSPAGPTHAYLLLINPSPQAFSATDWFAGCWGFWGVTGGFGTGLRRGVGGPCGVMSVLGGLRRGHFMHGRPRRPGLLVQCFHCPQL